MATKLTKLKWRINKFIVRLKWWFYKGEVHCHYFCPFCKYFYDCKGYKQNIEKYLRELYGDSKSVK